jgi:hypothetical protein
MHPGSAQPPGIPEWVVSDFCHQACAKGISDNVAGCIDQIFFCSNRVIVKAHLPKSPCVPNFPIQPDRA